MPSIVKGSSIGLILVLLSNKLPFRISLRPLENLPSTSGLIGYEKMQMKENLRMVKATRAYIPESIIQKAPHKGQRQKRETTVYVSACVLSADK